MPLFRNVTTKTLPTRRSSLRFKHDPIIYDQQGWQKLPAHPHYPTTPLSDATSSSSAPVQLNGSTSCSPHIVHKSSTRRGKKADHIPRPRNSFICFRSEFYKLKKKNPGGYDQNEISKEAGRVWTLLTPAEKQPFEEMAKREKEDHQLRYPTYSYAPGKENYRLLARTLLIRSNPSSSHLFHTSPHH
ncbi:high mobility group box domain-containing protein [Collybia nuda]|uniref:High mobility group box domain-containing protein n=1 Tax=Collybia nuda TaxID=64659 RepID=A0A9P6CPK9_9AGAR|nr:high mobility group box domain-containing protein [Collybia nuda]